MNVMVGSLVGVVVALWTAFVVLVTVVLAAPDPVPVRLDLGNLTLMDDTGPSVSCVMYLDEGDWC